ncbi:MAG: tail fiber domain-containing protein [Flavobacteriales bacterium]|jgi:hypothetical protein|nr:tail fiber domain-containing protein [Flavobacteriales bacterium]
MKTYNYLACSLLGFIFSTSSNFAQNVGVNTTGANPDASSILDISATDKGMLIPRVNIIDLNTAAPVTTPATSLLVYNTNITTGEGFYYWDGTSWVNITDNNGNADEDWYEVGTTADPDDINDNMYTMGRVSIGVNTTTNDFELSSGNDPSTFRITETSGTDVHWELRAYNVALGGDNNQFSIWGGLDGSTQTDRFVIEDNGNVGIGTTNPTELLEVSGGTGPSVIKIEADTDNTTESDQAYILMEQDGGTVQAHLGFGSTEATGDIFRIGIKSTIDPTIDYSMLAINGGVNRIGILTSSPTANLSVNGSANKVGTNTWTIISDKNFKKNITDYNQGLDLILKVKTHNFQYNQDLWDVFGENESIKNETYQGIIAQELEEIAPEMVKHIMVDYIDDNGKKQTQEILNVDTNKFTYALINSTKEQQAIIESQALKIKELEERLKAIESSLNK